MVLTENIPHLAGVLILAAILFVCPHCTPNTHPRSPSSLTRPPALLLLEKPLTRLLVGPLSRVPGPWYLKLSGWPKTYHEVTGNGPIWIQSLHEIYGPIVCIAPDTVDLCSPADAAQIHGFKRPFLKTKWYSALVPGSEGLFATRDVMRHRRDRRLLSGPLSETGLRAFAPQVERKVAAAVRRMREQVTEQTSSASSSGRRRGRGSGFVDVAHWWMCMTTDVIGELSFGRSFGALEHGGKTDYLRNLDAVSRSGGLMVAFPLLGRLPAPVVGLIPGLGDARRQEVENRRYAEEAVRRHRDMLDAAAAAAAPADGDDAGGEGKSDQEKKMEKGTAVRPTLFTKVIRAAFDEEAMTAEEVEDQAQGYIVAGSDTTATMLTYLTWALCRPEYAAIRARVMAELASLPPPPLSGDCDAAGVGGGGGGGRGVVVDEDEHLRELPYLGRVITEALRIYSPIPVGLPRYVPEGGAVFGGGKADEAQGGDGGFFLPAGTTVQTNAYSMHRNAAVFADPGTFDPDRWGEEQHVTGSGSVEETKKLMRDAWMPFGAGPRVCIGQHLAMMEIRMGLAAFFREFPDAKVSDREGFRDEVEMQPEMYVLMAPRGHRCLIDAA